MAKTIMLQGTSSNVGKSVLTAAFGRIFLQDGFFVAPFKAQNMALNSFVTSTGGEMGRAQVVQAEACKIKPDVIMNPVLLKPTQHASSQVVVLGKPIGNLSASEYHNQYKDKAWEVIKDSLEQLQNNYEVLVIEGAGSPAEINLKSNDVVNMKVAKEINAPVLLIADIDRGGALASIVGTLELLDSEEKDLVKGLIINKFRGDINLLKPALDFLEEKTGKPVVGVIPYFDEIKIPEEDSVVIEQVKQSPKVNNKINIAVIKLPHISNFTDFDALADEVDVKINYVENVSELEESDLIIIPGSKNTIVDMEFLKQSKMAEKIIYLNKNNKTPVIGICGGYQILGQKLLDPFKTESDLGESNGLGLLNIITEFSQEKITSQVKGKVLNNHGLLKCCEKMEIEGYEIHMGLTQITEDTEQPFLITERIQKKLSVPDGALSDCGLVFGTYLHGIFDNDLLRRQIINNIRELKGWQPIENSTINTKTLREEAYNKLAEVVRNNIDMDLIYKVMDLK